MKKVLVVFGGVSSEHDVSLVSASNVIANIPADKYEVLMLGITKEGAFYLFDGSPDMLPGGNWLKNGDLLEPAVISPDRTHHGVISLKNGKITPIDVVFPVLHGKNGEDGTIQGLLELSGIPYVGCPHLSSAITMDKAYTNLIADYYGVSQAKWLSFEKTDFDRDESALLNGAESKLGYPIFVKPANAGSSVGISKAVNRLELRDACLLAFRHDKKVVLEECITGKEVECAVLGNNDPVASAVGGIQPSNDFYDYEAKYVSNDSKLFIPADIGEDTAEEIRAEAVRIFRALGCRGLSRVDFFVRNGDNKVMFNEINTLPGFTSISMYPKLFEYSGIPYGELIDRLISLAVEDR